ncbi:hypothetical protein PPIS_b0049 [Pseudoalteromonas piscicida]|uniref:Uncharacterized protein n=1 Tax=Pseudoalteromonas piscicida TaxID=43662 RepID=A0ABM6NKA4_PSEO7|nr:hypothetical protein PPIS_b0049 [Pseudoalteromonas piscicida]
MPSARANHANYYNYQYKDKLEAIETQQHNHLIEIVFYLKVTIQHNIM